jgi:hypothetical protein
MRCLLDAESIQKRECRGGKATTMHVARQRTKEKYRCDMLSAGEASADRAAAEAQGYVGSRGNLGKVLLNPRAEFQEKIFNEDRP